MYNSIIESLDKDLNSKVLKTICLTFNTSISVYNELIEKESDIFSGDYFKEIKGRLLGFIIKRAFDPKLLPNNFPFDVQIINLPFKQKTPKLKRGNTVLTISKVMDSESLPGESKYKKELAKGNSIFNNQLEFNLDCINIQPAPYYGIIAYKFYDDELKSLKILIPDSDFKTVLRSISVPIVHVFEDEEIQEDTILSKESLKQSVLNDINLKIIN